jgi:hypothetical protein
MESCELDADESDVADRPQHAFEVFRRLIAKRIQLNGDRGVIG